MPRELCRIQELAFRVTRDDLACDSSTWRPKRKGAENKDDCVGVAVVTAAREPACTGCVYERVCVSERDREREMCGCSAKAWFLITVDLVRIKSIYCRFRASGTKPLPMPRVWLQISSHDLHVRCLKRSRLLSSKVLLLLLLLSLMLLLLPRLVRTNSRHVGRGIAGC